MKLNSLKLILGNVSRFLAINTFAKVNKSR